MITLSVLTTVVLVIAAIVIAIALTCGAGLLVVLGDLIVGALIIALFVKLFNRGK